MSKNSGVKGLVIILVVAVLLAGGWFVYKAYKADPAVEENLPGADQPAVGQDVLTGEANGANVVDVSPSTVGLPEGIDLNTADFPNVEKEYLLADGSKLLYKAGEYEQHVITISSGGEEKIINRYPSCSQPVVSPDGTRFAYIDVLEWEELGEVYLYDVETGTQELIMKRNKDFESQHTPKDLVWLDDNHLLAVIGFAYGTVSVGGNLHVYDLQKQETRLALEAGEREEITSVKVAPDKVIVHYVEFDEEYNHTTDVKKEFSRAGFLELVEK